MAPSSYIANKYKLCYYIRMLKLQASLRLNTDKEALVASASTFVLTAIFFVMALMLFPVA
ncbi:MAG: hypothetical protein KAS32_07845 [Candidatus Peribacteraceae bacterium]|nr:hypothetical protein [Candidatus Peribacteraceae bacterium]